MKDLKKYKVSIAQLAEKAHNYQFNGEGDFFKYFEVDNIENGNFEAKLILAKTETMIQVNFEIKGTLQLVCDRSLEVFDFPFEANDEVILKFGDHDEELGDGIRLIDRHTSELNFAHDIYELIWLTVPMKKLHPKYSDEEIDENAEGHIVYSTLSSKIEEKEQTIDPRWKALEKLK